MTVQNEGERRVKRNVKYYNLDVIIAVGYRVKSIRGTQFRIWANKLIKEYLIKGYNIDSDRMKNNGGGVYFEELLEKIRDIRSSEKVFWRTDQWSCYKRCSSWRSFHRRNGFY